MGWAEVERGKLLPPSRSESPSLLMPKQICTYPGCIRTQIESRCDEHKKSKYAPNPAQRPKANKGFYNSSQWQKLRKLVLNRDAICQIQTRCNGAPANQVDHITPIEAGGSKTDLDNLQGACQKCHSHKTHTIDIPLIRTYQEG